MRLKTKLVLAITGLVFLVVTVLSWLFLEQLLAQRISQSYAANDMVARQILYSTQLALTNGLRSHSQLDPHDPTALRAAVLDVLQHDEGLNGLLSSVNRYAPTVFDVAVADRDGKALLSTDPTQDNVTLPEREDYALLQHAGVITTMRAVFGPPRNYNIILPLERTVAPGRKVPFLTIRVGIRTTFLRTVFAPWIWASLTFTGIAIISSLLVAALLANLALQPIEQISLRLDTLEQEDFDRDGESIPPQQAELPPPTRESPAWMRPATLIRPSAEDPVGQVSNKIERIGRRMRNVEEVFSALKENLDSIMSNLQDGILLFTADGRAALVSDSVERFLGLPRTKLFGGSIASIFTLETKIGRLVRDAFENGNTLDQEEVETETGRRVQVSLDFVVDQDSAPGASLGALLTLHDLESVRELESELELSRRLAAIGRLTSGVGHEVKNPINAIVVHLELLRNKLSGPDARAMRHLEIIESEIQRLDRVVQTLVDFSRPVELQLKEQDLRRIVSGVLMLASAELETHNVRVSSHMPERPVITKVDADLIKQAILNVVLNGAQAMSQGGELHVTLREDGRMAAIEISDSGSGIPDDIRAKIFDLYFTTRKDGSGIGLAMTYRIIQLHNGSIDVQSEQNIGSTFTLKLPLLASAEGKLRGSSLDKTIPAPAFTSEGSGL
jgi:signal transduction histidine kinase